MIDKIIHQIWVGKYEMPDREKNQIAEIKEKHSNYDYHLWTNDNLPKIPERLQKIYDIMYNNEDYVFCADMLRWLVVYEYGGWYLDVDWKYVNSLDSLSIDHRDGIVFGHWGVGWTGCDYTLANNVFGFKKHHPLVKHMIDNMPDNNPYCPYSPGWTGIEVKKYVGLENQFSNEIWEYHRIVREHLDAINIEYGDYNKFQVEVLNHLALYAWSAEQKEKFKNGTINDRQN